MNVGGPGRLASLHYHHGQAAARSGRRRRAPSRPLREAPLLVGGPTVHLDARGRYQAWQGLQSARFEVRQPQVQTVCDVQVVHSPWCRHRFAHGIIDQQEWLPANRSVDSVV